ncbi:MAG: hypothetical protein AAGF24_05295 [Cyanobacteria bacterium P01_H01_bin.121]
MEAPAKYAVGASPQSQDAQTTAAVRFSFDDCSILYLKFWTVEAIRHVLNMMDLLMQVPLTSATLDLTGVDRAISWIPGANWPQDYVPTYETLITDKTLRIWVRPDPFKETRLLSELIRRDYLEWYLERLELGTIQIEPDVWSLNLPRYSCLYSLLQCVTDFETGEIYESSCTFYGTSRVHVKSYQALYREGYRWVLGEEGDPFKPVLKDGEPIVLKRGEEEREFQA